jgi:hypothetical protein
MRADADLQRTASPPHSQELLLPELSQNHVSGGKWLGPVNVLVKAPKSRSLGVLGERYS